MLLSFAAQAPRTLTGQMQQFEVWAAKPALASAVPRLQRVPAMATRDR